MRKSSKSPQKRCRLKNKQTNLFKSPTKSIKKLTGKGCRGADYNGLHGCHGGSVEQ